MFNVKFWQAIGEFAVASLAYLILFLIVLVFLLGPFAIWFAAKNYPIAAALAGIAAIWLGLQWYVGVYTWPKYLGIVSACMGAYAIWLAATKR
jgi:uncharacterized Tic20 family protein